MMNLKESTIKTNDFFGSSNSLLDPNSRIIQKHNKSPIRIISVDTIDTKKKNEGID